MIYDPHGRQNTTTDLRNGTTTFIYNNADLVATNISPNPGTPGTSSQVTATFYNRMLQATNVLTPDGAWMHDPKATESRANEFGTLNSVVVVRA